MSFLEKFSDAVTNTGAAVGSKAKELTEVAKIKNEIATTQKKMKDEYETIGRLYAENFGTEPEDIFRDSLERIQSYQNVIKQKQNLLNEVKKVKVCPSCGATIAETNAFCGNCGQKVE